MAEVVPISGAVRSARESVLQQVLDGYNRGDIDTLVSAFTRPRIEVIPSGRVYDGEDAVRTHYTDRNRSFRDQSFEMIALHHSDDVAVSEYWMTATHIGEIDGVEAGNRKFRVRMVSVFVFENADLVGQRIYFDMGTIARQLA